MAQIQKTQNGIMIRWDSSDWLKGLLPDFNSSGTGQRLGDGFSNTTAINPYRKPGYLMLGYAGSDADNVADVNAILKNWAVNGSYAYATSAGANLFKITVASATIPIDADQHAITPHGHSSAVGEDVVVYYANVSSTLTKLLFYSWNDNTDGDVGTYNFGTWTTAGNFNDDFMSTVPTGAAVLNKSYPHPMVVGDDNILYIGDGKNLASYQGTTGTDGAYNSSALDLPNDYVITSFAKTPDFLVIYAYKSAIDSGSQTYQSGECTAFFWDYSSPSYTYAYPIEGGYINGGFNLGSTPGCFIQGQTGDIVSGHQSKMLLFSGGEFRTEITFNGAIPGRGGVDTSGESIIWNSAGTIYQYGSPYIGYPKGLNKISFGSGTTIEGLLKAITITSSTSGLVASTGTTTSGGLQIFRANYSGSGSAYTGLKVLPSNGRDIWKVDYVKVNYLNTLSGAGRSFALALNVDNNNTSFNQRGLFVYVYDSGSSTYPAITTLTNIYDVNTDGEALPVVSNSLGLLFTWGTALPADATDAIGVESVEVYLIPTPASEN